MFKVFYRAFQHFKYFVYIIFRKDDVQMVEWLAARVYRGYMTAMEGQETPQRPLVPLRIRPAVIEALTQMGLDPDGVPIVE